jgi:nitroreductase
VRRYLDKPIEESARNVIDDYVDIIIKQSGLNIKVCYDEPKAFQTLLAHYGSFRKAVNYVAFIGKKEAETKVGYFGEAIVLKLQEIGINSCWVAVSYSKRKTPIEMQEGEDILSVVSFGYGETQGVNHRSKKYEDVTEVVGEKPSWFDLGVEAALLAPTAVNQQKFKIVCDNGKVSIKKNGRGFYQDIDLGILQYHFEAVTGQKVEVIK